MPVGDARGTRLVGAFVGAVIVLLGGFAGQRTALGAFAIWPFRRLTEFFVLRLGIPESVGTTLAVVLGLCGWSLVFYLLATLLARLTRPSTVQGEL